MNNQLYPSYFTLLAFFILLFAINKIELSAQNNDSLSRNVTVERIYQPIVQTSSKVEMQPDVIEYPSSKKDVDYSDSSYSFPFKSSMKPIIPSKETFEKNTNKLHGKIEGGIGHADTYFDFWYQIKDAKKSLLDIAINHNAYWGFKALSKTNIGINFKHDFSNSQVYFHLGGDNEFFTYHGRYYNINSEKENRKLKLNDLPNSDKRSLWTLNTYIGIKANKWNEFQYKVQFGYRLFRYSSVAEHSIQTDAMIGWKGDIHGGGINLLVQNNLFAIDTNYIPLIKEKKRHAFRIEPFYSITSDRFVAHFGINLDINIGTGKMLSSKNNISLAPSPNINFEFFITKSWLSFYANLKGHFSTNSLHSNLKSIRFLNDSLIITSSHVPEYTPMDAIAGFYIKAHKNLLIDVHLGYAFHKNQKTLYINSYTETPQINEEPVIIQHPFIEFGYTDYTSFRGGANFSYHYKDKIKINLSADYIGMNRKKSDIPTNNPDINKKTVYDRPTWIISLKGNFMITKQWMLYTDNIFYGGVKSLLKIQDINPELPPRYVEKKLNAFIDVNLGVKYLFQNNNLSLFLQLNNILCRHNDMFYTYKTPGINGIAGVVWKF